MPINSFNYTTPVASAPIGQIVSGQLANNPAYLPCDGNDYSSNKYPLLDKTNLTTIGNNSPIASTLPTSQVWSAIASNNNIIVAISSTSGTNAASSSDGGVTWTARVIPSGGYYAVTWNGAIFCAVGTNVCATSTDGITWTTRTIGTGNWSCIAWTIQSGLFVVGISSNSADVQTSPDGITWTTRTGVLLNTDSRAGIFNINGQFWLMPNTTSTSSVPSYFLVSDDGLNWKYRLLPAVTVGDNTNWAYAAFFNGRAYIGCAVSGGSYLYSTYDAVNWTTITTPSYSINRGVFAFGGYLFTVQFGTYNIMSYSVDGVIWKSKMLPSSQSWGQINASSAGIVILPAASSSAAAFISVDNTKFRTPKAQPQSDIDRIYIKVA